MQTFASVLSEWASDKHGQSVNGSSGKLGKVAEEAEYYEKCVIMTYFQHMMKHILYQTHSTVLVTLVKSKISGDNKKKTTFAEENLYTTGLEGK